MDQFEQYAPFTATISKTNHTCLFTKVNFGVKPTDRVGILIRDITFNVWDLETVFNTHQDTIDFALIDTNNISSYAEVSLLNPRVKAWQQWKYQKYGTPANERQVLNEGLHANFRDYAGGGILMHAAAIYVMTRPFQTTAPASDKTIVGRFAFQYVELDEAAYKELWEAMYIPATV